MTLRITVDTASQLAEYATVPIRFLVTETFDTSAVDALRRGAHAPAAPVSHPYVKDYDAYTGNHPTDWPARFDTSDWIMLAARLGGTRVGGAIVVVDDPHGDMARDPDGVALLWDLRVAPDVRRQGIGSALLRAAEEAALRRGSRVLRVETQQVNVAACRFYQRHRFSLERVSPGAYPQLPEEVELIWKKRLGARARAVSGPRSPSC